MAGRPVPMPVCPASKDDSFVRDTISLTSSCRDNVRMKAKNSMVCGVFLNKCHSSHYRQAYSPIRIIPSPQCRPYLVGFGFITLKPVIFLLHHQGRVELTARKNDLSVARWGAWGREGSTIDVSPLFGLHIQSLSAKNRLRASYAAWHTPGNRKKAVLMYSRNKPSNPKVKT